MIKTFTLSVDVKAAVGNDKEFPESIHAREILSDLLQKGAMYYLDRITKYIAKEKIQNAGGDTDEQKQYISYLEGAIKAAEAIQVTIKDINSNPV